MVIEKIKTHMDNGGILSVDEGIDIQAEFLSECVLVKVEGKEYYSKPGVYPTFIFSPKWQLQK